MEPLTFIALESGAGFPAWALELRQRASEVVVEAALPGESLESFADRITHRLLHLASRGKRVQAASYVVAADHVGDRDAALRRRMCESLLGAIEPGVEAKFVLGVKETHLPFESPIRLRMVELCGDLAGRYLGRTVSVRFEGSAQESGVFPVERASDVPPPARASRPSAASHPHAPHASASAVLRPAAADRLWAEGR